jgi:hypothetical protein
MNDCQDKVLGIVGNKVVKAVSSLHQFAIEFSGDQCLILDAVNGDSGPAIAPQVGNAANFPQSGDAVCAVDWSWIYGGELKSVDTRTDQIKLNLSPQGTITVSVAVWQGKPFLSFMPYKPPGK